MPMQRDRHRGHRRIGRRNHRCQCVRLRWVCDGKAVVTTIDHTVGYPATGFSASGLPR